MKHFNRNNKTLFLGLVLAFFILGFISCNQEMVDPEDPMDHNEIDLTWEQLSFGCMVMGNDSMTHLMCNHGHSLNYRSEPLYERMLYLKSMGEDSINEARLMMTDTAGMNGPKMPEPFTPILQAAVGERVRLRVVSYGPDFHTFHVHGHVWLGGDSLPEDTKTLGPAEVYDEAEFYAGGYWDKPDARGGAGDWMYHCHVETHVPSGMWGIFRVVPKGSAQDIGADSLYPWEVPASMGQAGDTIDIWVVAIETPLSVTRQFDSLSGGFTNVDRLVRIYYPLNDQQDFDNITASAVRNRIRTSIKPVGPWVLSLRLNVSVRVHLKNLIPNVPVSLHPHGVVYTIDHDGTNPDDAAYLGGSPVIYNWKADVAGTWPLHDHQKTVENLGRGLFAAFVVKTPAEEAGLDRDYLIFFHDFEMNWFMGMVEPMGMGH